MTWRSPRLLKREYTPGIITDKLRQLPRRIFTLAALFLLSAPADAQTQYDWYPMGSCSTFANGTDYTSVNGNIIDNGDGSVEIDGAGCVTYEFESRRNIGWQTNTTFPPGLNNHHGLNSQSLGVYVEGRRHFFGGGGETRIFAQLSLTGGGNTWVEFGEIDTVGSDNGLEYSLANYNYGGSLNAAPRLFPTPQKYSITNCTFQISGAVGNVFAWRHCDDSAGQILKIRIVSTGGGTDIAKVRVYHKSTAPNSSPLIDFTQPPTPSNSVTIPYSQTSYTLSGVAYNHLVNTDDRGYDGSIAAIEYRVNGGLWTEFPVGDAPNPCQPQNPWSRTISDLQVGSTLVDMRAINRRCETYPPGTFQRITIIREDQPPCSYSIDDPSHTFPSNGGSHDFDIITQTGCSWSASPSAGWVNITSGSSSSGNGTVSYTVQPNTSANSRQATITVQGQQHNITQDAASCTYAIDPPSIGVPSSGGNRSFTVTTFTGCSWIAEETSSWIDIYSGNSGNSTGTVEYTVQPNTSALMRTATIMVNGQTHTITQGGVSCSYSLSEYSHSFGSGAGSRTFNVITSDGCDWQANANAGWVNITDGFSGNGTGTVSFTVEANTSTSSRSTTIIAGDRTYSISQAGTACDYSLSEYSHSFGSGAGSRTFSVITSDGCDWQANANAGWVNITDGFSGNGTGTVSFTVEANTSTSSRSTTIIAGDRTYSISQAGTACDYSLSEYSHSFGSGAGSRTFNVITSDGCDWQANANAGWVNITDGFSGNGTGTVSFTVDANTSTISRSTTIIAGWRVYSISQAGLACEFSISPETQMVPSEGGDRTFSVNTSVGCAWTATENSDWISLINGSGTGPGTVTFNVLANTDELTRTTTINIQGQTHSITQAAPLFSQEIKMIANDGSAGDEFGTSIAMDNALVAIGAPRGGSNDFGSAYLYDAASGALIHNILPNEDTPPGSFGYSIAICNGIVAVGAPYYTVGSSAAYLFDASTGEQLYKLIPNDGPTSEWFGSSIAICNGIVAVSATSDDDNGAESGAVYLFDATTGNQVNKLLPNEGSEGAYFGTSISMSGGIITVGANNDNENGSGSGSAYVFDVSTGDQIYKLLPNDGSEGDRFGSSIAISNGIVAVGARWDGDNGSWSGSAYLFDVSTGSQIYKLLPNDGSPNEWFGASIAINNGLVAAGVWRDGDSGLDSGSVYLFDALTGNQIYKLLPDDGSEGDAFGSSVAVSNSFVAVGAFWDGDNGPNSGSAYVFTSQNGGTCNYSIADSSHQFSSSGGTHSFSVSTQSGCSWSASDNASWVVITSATSGSGNGTVSYTVDSNPSIDLREATITVGGQQHTITQSGAPCNYSLSDSSESFPSDGGSHNFDVITQSGCSWSASDNAGWVSIITGSGGSGTDIIIYSIEPNTGTDMRQATITAAGQEHTITQSGVSCDYSLSDSSQSFPSDGGSGGFSVFAQSACSWSASGNASWVIIDGAASGSGDGFVDYTVQPNTSSNSRDTVITVQGEPYTISQSGVPCEYSIPNSQMIPSDSGSHGFSVTAPQGCTWTTSENSPWIKDVTSTGSGTGTISFNVTANPSSVPRSADIAVEGRMHTVIQAGNDGNVIKLLPNDGAAEDEFGNSVAISGTTAIVGAWSDDENGIDSGSAYLFNTTTGQQIAKLLPDDGAAGDEFGVAVAISGSRAIVGAHGYANGLFSGSAYLFDTVTGQQITKLLPSDSANYDYFGSSVAIGSTAAIVGARFDDDNGTSSGSAYLFDITSGQQIAKLIPNDGAEGDRFGVSVAISGNTAIVGAAYNDDNGINSGSAYLFDTTTGQQIDKLLPDDGASGDAFGNSVAISGSFAVIGSTYADDNGPSSGSAYLFDTSSGQQIAKLLPLDGEAGDQFGLFVAISGDTAVVGAHGNDDNGTNSGSAYLFDTKTGQQIDKILPNDGDDEDEFGRSVAISGNMAFVGALNDDDHGTDSGAAYLFGLSIPEVCPADLTGDGTLNFFDVSAFLIAYQNTDPMADMNGDGHINFFDVSEFLIAFQDACP